jgi:hypothetical protein
VLIPAPMSEGVIACTCGRCKWVSRIKETDMVSAQAAFDAHFCEDFPREKEA